MKNRLFFIIGILFIGITAIAFFVTRSKKTTESPSLSSRAPIAPVVKPSFPESLPRPQPNYAVPPVDQPFPSSVRTVVYSHLPITNQQAATMANALGVSSQPVEIPGNRGTLYSWSNNGQTLTIGGDPVEISYTFYQSSTTPIGSQNIDSDALIAGFRQRIGHTMPGVELKKIKTTLYESTGFGPKETTNTQAATTLRADYSFTIDNYPIYTRYPSAPALSVQINGNRNLEQFNTYWYKGIQKTHSVTPIITYEEAVQRLLGGEGALLAVNTQDPPLTDIPQKFSVQTSTISRVELAYYYTPGNTILAPVFVFNGQGVDTEKNVPVETLTVVSALPSQVPQP
jgi:hypothetical protein